jgi:very-short-patch-repair endonuclease
MPQLSPSLASIVRSRHGVVTVDQLQADSLGRNTIRRLVTAGALVQAHAGVYRVATAPDTFEARCAAACAADPTAVVTGPAAARLWTFHHVFRPGHPILLVAHDETPLSRGVELRRTNVLDPSDSIHRPDGIRVATPERAWFDCARDLTDERFEMLTEWVLDRHTTVPTLWAMRRRLAGRGRPGAARVNGVLSRRAAWQRPAGSGLEVKVLRALGAVGIAALVRQHPIRLQNGVVIHPDAALPGIKWALEIDHVTWHGGRLDAQRDKGRDRQLRRIGWQVDRVTDVEIRDRFELTMHEIVQLIALRRRSPAA